MQAATLRSPIAAAPAPRLELRARVGLAAICLVAGAAPLAVRWIPDLTARIAFGLLIAAGLLALWAVGRKVASLRPYRDLALVFFVFALVQVLNNSIPDAFRAYLLRDAPTTGNPLASTVSGSVAMQLLETAIAIVPILVLIKLAGLDLGSVYARRGAGGRWLVLAIGVFLALYVFVATLPLRPGSPAQRLLPTNGPVTLDRLLALTPALLVMVLSNGFQEEFLFRGLFLQQYERFFGARVANVLQAAVFSVAHVDVSYTPLLLVFLAGVVFPAGLLAGFLMRASRGVVVPSIVHAGLDIPIYLGFLSYVA